MGYACSYKSLIMEMYIPGLELAINNEDNTNAFITGSGRYDSGVLYGTGTLNTADLELYSNIANSCRIKKQASSRFEELLSSTPLTSDGRYCDLFPQIEELFRKPTTENMTKTLTLCDEFFTASQSDRKAGVVHVHMHSC